jgi:hypothetical protein
MTTEALPSHYKNIAAGATNTVLGAGSNKGGDFILSMNVIVTAAATSQVQLKDGGDAAFTVVPANTPVGVYSLYLALRAQKGAWQVSTQAGVSANVAGDFT